MENGKPFDVHQLSSLRERPGGAILFLVGFMASGKTTIGRAVARRAGYDFVDLDELIEREEGQSVSALFAGRGEAAFRSLETRCLERVCALQRDTVVATGGGTPCFNGNMERMNRCGTTVYLKFSPEDLKTRIQLSSQSTRPLVAGKSEEELLRYVKETLACREQYYNKATVVMEGTDEEIAERITRLISNR